MAMRLGRFSGETHSFLDGRFLQVWSVRYYDGGLIHTITVGQLLHGLAQMPGRYEEWPDPEWGRRQIELVGRSLRY